MRVFVLTTGRSGSVTFSKACAHLENFTSAHESLASGRLFDARFYYPDQHIEIDNRLSWFLGELGTRFGSDAFFVHLKRDEDLVARSFLRRWEAAGWRGSIIESFAHGVLMHASDWKPEDKLDVCRFYVQAVNRNIEEFIKDKPSCSVSLGRIEEDFGAFLAQIGATGDLGAAMSEWRTFHNRSG